MKKIIIILIPVVFLCLSVCAEAQEHYFQRIYSKYSGANEYGNDICESNGYYYVASSLRNGFSAWIIKLKQNGDTVWTREYRSGNVSYSALSIASTDDGGCVFSGYRLTNSNAPPFTIKLDSNGKEVWNKEYTGLIGDVPINVLIKLNDGGFCGLGITFKDSYIFKINKSGDLVWQNIYSNESRLYLRSLIESEDNEIIAAGTFGSGNSQGIILKINLSNGVEIKRKELVLDSIQDYVLFDIKKLNNGRYLVAGENVINYKTLFGMINDSLNMVKLFSISHPNEQNYYGGVDINPKKQIIYGSYSIVPGNDSLFMNMIRLDTNGNIIIKKRIGNRSREIDNRKVFALNNNVNFFVGGYEINATTGNDVYVVKTDSNFFTTSLISIRNHSIFISDFTLHQNYPNPFNPSTKISYSLKKSSIIELKLFDINGRMMKIIESGLKPAGSYEINFSAEGLSSGVYFFSLYSEGILMDTKKAVMIK